MMHPGLHYELQFPPSQDGDILFEGINEQAVQKKGLRPVESFGIFLKNDKKEVVAGLTGIFLYGCVHIDLLWVQEKYRDQKMGKDLMFKAEEFAREKECHFATVFTMDWEALPFYQKLGYEIEFVREGYEKQSRMYMLRKQL
jgi:ribosomal protein S18 acetylase RimI-like enzyme